MSVLVGPPQIQLESRSLSLSLQSNAHALDLDVTSDVVGEELVSRARI